MSVSLLKPYRFPSLRHYTEDPMMAPLHVSEQLVDKKPRGIWVSDDSCGDGWLQWCQENEFRAEALEFVHDVRLKPNAKLIWLRSPEAIDQFTAAYGIASNRWGLGPADDRTVNEIDWPCVAEIYDGILITPYQRSRRYERETGWYHSWDVASGCIWNPAAIESVLWRREEWLAA